MLDLWESRAWPGADSGPLGPGGDAGLCILTAGLQLLVWPESQEEGALLFHSLVWLSRTQFTQINCSSTSRDSRHVPRLLNLLRKRERANNSNDCHRTPAPIFKLPQCFKVWVQPSSSPHCVKRQVQLLCFEAYLTLVGWGHVPPHLMCLLLLLQVMHLSPLRTPE